MTCINEIQLNYKIEYSNEKTFIKLFKFQYIRSFSPLVLFFPSFN